MAMRRMVRLDNGHTPFGIKLDRDAIRNYQIDSRVY
jgi:hypothetical protein